MTGVEERAAAAARVSAEVERRVHAHHCGTPLSCDDTRNCPGLPDAVTVRALRQVLREGAADLLAQPTADEAEGDEREELARTLAAVVAAINALHRPREVTVFAGPTKGSKTTVCSACEMSEPDWPCPTVAALRAALATPPAPERNGEGGGSDG